MDDLILFIKYSLKLDDFAITKNPHIKEDKRTKLNYISLNKSNFLKYFTLYIILICFFFYFLKIDDELNNDVFNELRANNIKSKSYMNFEYLSLNLLDVFENSKKHKTYLSSCEIKNSKVFLKLQAEKKEHIYSFLNSMNISISNIFYEQKSKRYKCNAVFKLPRKSI